MKQFIPHCTLKFSHKKKNNTTCIPFRRKSGKLVFLRQRMLFLDNKQPNSAKFQPAFFVYHQRACCQAFYQFNITKLEEVLGFSVLVLSTHIQVYLKFQVSQHDRKRCFTINFVSYKIYYKQHVKCMPRERERYFFFLATDCLFRCSLFYTISIIYKCFHYIYTCGHQVCISLKLNEK
jgi:hypothetical protein